jgi:senataxin
VIAERKDKIEQAHERKWLALDALQVLAFDGAEAEPYQTWIKDRIAVLMTGCDVCVRVFHQSRGEWKTRLVDSYDEEMVHDFLKVIDDICIGRICKGLDEARDVLIAAEPKQRGVRILPSEATYAFFEALSCNAFIRNEELLQKHFDVPFGLVQTKKRLKLQTFVPAMTRFLFSKNASRHEWAAQSWSGSKRNILPSEFEWTVRDHLMDAMMRVQMTNLDLDFAGNFWFAVKLIITKCDKDLITHNIRGLDMDFYKLALDHLSLRSEGFLDLIATITLLLEKSPTDFWDAMDAITPSTATVVEQVFNSPVLKSIFIEASEENKTRMEELDEAFTWVGPFVSSIKAANLTPACKAFSNLLFSRLQADHFSRVSRARCYKEGLWVLDFAFKKMNEGKNLTTFVGQPTVNGMLEILKTHIKLIVTSLKRFGDSPETKEDLKLALSMIQQAFTLECQSLAVERQLITLSRPSPTETPPSSPIWTAIIKAIDANSIDLATHLLIAGKYLVGLELLHMKPGVDKIPPTIRHFNDRFKLLSQSVTDVIDRLAEFDPRRLGALLEQPAAATALISTLFSSTEDTRNSSVELLKVISAQDARRDALQYILKTYYKNVLEGVSSSSRQVMRKKTLAPAPSLVKTCSDIIDVMCNSQDGILRSRSLDSSEAAVTMNLWKSLWDLLTMVFQMTEDWAALAVYDKDTMKDFCRDTMQFADQLFDQCSIFSTALKESASNPADTSSTTKLLKELLELPARTMEGMAKWLRLRDEFLSQKSVTLIGKLLIRLRRVSIEVDPETLSYMEGVLSGKIRAKLSMQQQAELLRALETHLGHSISKQEEPVKQPKQGSISKWMAQGSTSSDVKAKDDVTRKSLLADASRTATAFQAKREAIRAREAAAAKMADASREAAQSEFKKKRQAELEKAKAEKAAAIAKARKERGLSDHTAEAGSGLEGLGVLGKEQAPKGEGLMHSSDESDDEGDFDDDLFGIKRPDRPRAGPKTNIVNEIKVQMPVKKRKVVRSMKDMRARLAPDLTQLHKTILGWDYFHNGDFPPSSRTDIYKAVPKTFRTPQDYQDVFQPLLTLEAWQGFVKSREENTIKPYEIRVVSRASIDAFQEVSSTMTHAENKELGLSEGDIVLLSQSKMPNADDRYCLARVFRVQRKQAHLEVSYRVLPSNPLLSSLVPNGTVYGSKIQSITPLEREFGALAGLMYYDLCDEILRAKPSPLLTYKDSQLDSLISTYNVNKAQAKAVKSAIDNDAFTLIQGYVLSNISILITKTIAVLLVQERQRLLSLSWVPYCRTVFATTVRPLTSLDNLVPILPRRSFSSVLQVTRRSMN